jgi:hypothetical protein
MGGDILFDDTVTKSERKLVARIIACAGFIAAKSNYLIAQINRLGDFGHKTARILWMVDRRTFRPIDPKPLRGRLGIVDDENVILIPKSLQRAYNAHLVVDSMPAILKRHPKTKLLISEQMVQADYKSEIQARISHLGISDHVLFVGHIANEDMPEFYSVADAVVDLHVLPGFPMAFLEAAACGAATIVAQIENTKEIVTNGYNALTVDFSANSVANAINRLFERPELRQQLVSNALVTIDQLPSLSEELHLIENRFCDLLEHPHPRPTIEQQWRIIRDSLSCSLMKTRETYRRLGGGIVLAIFRDIAMHIIGDKYGPTLYFLLRRKIGRPALSDPLPPEATIHSAMIKPCMQHARDMIVRPIVDSRIHHGLRRILGRPAKPDDPRAS